MIKTGLIATAIAGLLMSGISFWGMNALPISGEIPIHWNIKGEPDNFASPEEARRIIWMIPGLSILIGLVLALGAKIDPRRKNIERSSRAYLAGWIGTLVFMVFISALVAYSMVKGSVDPDLMSEFVPSVVVGSISVLFLILGNYLPKTRSNWFFGIRTPWTLSSEVTWAKTHRITGRLFIAMGLLGLLSAIFAPSIFKFSILISGTLLIAGFSLIYSYVIWRDAPDRVTAADYVE